MKTIDETLRDLESFYGKDKTSFIYHSLFYPKYNEKYGYFKGYMYTGKEGILSKEYYNHADSMFVRWISLYWEERNERKDKKIRHRCYEKSG